MLSFYEVVVFELRFEVFKIHNLLIEIYKLHFGGLGFFFFFFFFGCIIISVAIKKNQKFFLSFNSIQLILGFKETILLVTCAIPEVFSISSHPVVLVTYPAIRYNIV
jgi:hypothetical protein